MVQVKARSRPRRIPGADPGKWNQFKCKVLFALTYQGVADGNVQEPEGGTILIHTKRRYCKYIPINNCDLKPITWLNVRILADYTGVPARSLYTLLPRWYRWGYVQRTEMAGDYHSREWAYAIAPKGVTFMARFGSYILPLEKYIAEIAERNKENKTDGKEED